MQYIKPWVSPTNVMTNVMFQTNRINILYNYYTFIIYCNVNLLNVKLTDETVPAQM